MRYQRELTAAVLIPAVLALLVAGPEWGWALLVAAATLLALLEFYGMLRGHGWAVPRLLGVAILLGLLAAAYLKSPTAVFLGLVGIALFGLPTLVMFSSPPVETLLPASASAVFSTLYVAAGGAAVVGLRAVGWKPVVFLLAVVWAGDSAAYYAGRKWGRRKLAPVVSPKKTWEGFWGQLAGGGAAGALVVALTATGRGLAPIAVAAGLGVVLSAAAVVGDLVESTFKRSCEVKDSGTLLPGHGGLLDRLDSLLYAGPVLLLVVTLLPKTTAW